MVASKGVSSVIFGIVGVGINEMIQMNIGKGRLIADLWSGEVLKSFGGGMVFPCLGQLYADSQLKPYQSCQVILPLD
jgi:hypothetical protein